MALICDFSDLRAISEGFSTDTIELYGGQYCIALTEAFTKLATAQDARKQAEAVLNGPNMQAAARSMTAARDLAQRGDLQGSLREYDNAVAAYKRLRAEASSIDDDILEEIYNDQFFKVQVVIIASWILFAIGTGLLTVAPAISMIINAVSGCGFVGSMIAAVLLLKEYEKAVYRSKKVTGGTLANGKWNKEFHQISDSRDSALEKIDSLIMAAEIARSEVLRQLKNSK